MPTVDDMDDEDIDEREARMGRNSARKERAPRSFWFDPRFAIGIGLVVVSVIGVLCIVRAADSSVRVYAARAALSPGDRVDAADFVVQSVRLGDLTGRYLGDGDVPHDGLVVTKAVAAGELVPASAVGETSGTRMTSVVVAVRGQLAKSVSAGAVVDVWAAHEVQNQEFGAPAVLVSAATVVRLVETAGIIADDSGGSVEVLVPRTKVARVLEAIANEDAISLVPASIPVRG